VAALARNVDRRCRSFYHSPRRSGTGPRHTELEINPAHLDAMWAEIETGVPTVNGYSGATPPGWSPLYDAIFEKPQDRDRIGRALAAWATLHGMSPDEICWVRDGDGPPPSRAEREPTSPLTSDQVMP
jgi:hypothetical protein